MTDDYIRKQDAVDALKAQADTMRTWVERYAEQRIGILTAVNIVEDIKPADVVPVVRCKDCKHCYFADNRVPDEQGWVCEINSSEPVNLNGFCSYGERRKQE